jgi:hypothetical protein
MSFDIRCVPFDWYRIYQTHFFDARKNSPSICVKEVHSWGLQASLNLHFTLTRTSH